MVCLSKTKNKTFFFTQVGKRSIGCSLEALPAITSPQIFQFPNLHNSKASCNIVMPYMYICIRIKMLKTNIKHVLYGFMLMIRN